MAPAILGSVGRAATQEEADDADDDPYEDEEVEEDDAAPVDDGKVVTLTSENFDSVIKDNVNVLVEFYAPWCGHCQEMAPEYSKASLILAEQAPEVVLAKVDATEETTLAEKYGVEGFPTLFWFHSGEHVDYEGGREAEHIVKWVLKRVGPAATTVATVEELQALEKDNDVVVVGYFNDLKSETPSESLDHFHDACRNINFECAQTSVAAVAEYAGASLGSVSLVSKLPPETTRKTTAYTGQMDAEEIEKFVNTESLPLVIPFAGPYGSRIFEAGIPHHLLLVAEPSALTEDTPLMKMYLKLAGEVRSQRKFLFVSVDAESEDSEAVITYFGVDKTKLPAVYGFTMEPNQSKYKLKGEVTEKNLEDMMKGILDGSLEPDLKSDEIPEDDMDGHVKVVVGKSFDSIVKDPTKDVLLEVYAPWCGHCKNLEPIYKKLAARFKDIDSVVIAKMDGTTNEHGDLNVEGFPHLVFYPAKEGAEGISLGNERTLKGMTKFIKEHAVIPYELKKKQSSDDKADEGKDEL